MAGRREVREITSPGNALLKVFRRALAEGVTREGWLAVEGPHLLEEALQAVPRAAVERVLVARSGARKFSALLARLPREAEVIHVSDHLFARVAQTESPQGIAVLVERRADDLDAILARRDVVLLVACELQDPGNLGTLMRSGQALGATAVLNL